MKIIFTFLILNFVIGGKRESQQSYWMEPLTNTSGLYQEHLGLIHFTKNTWRIDIKIDLSDFKNDVEALMRSINNTKMQCSDNNAQLGCAAISKELMQREKMIESKVTELLLIMHPKIRLKRDILDKVGRIGNVLFGLMDEKDLHSAR